MCLKGIVVLKTFFTSLILVTLLSGCITRVYQVDGQPIPDKYVSAHTLSLDLKVTYNVTNQFKVNEGDETYKTYSHLDLDDQDVQKIKNTEGISSQVFIFNPKKSHYKVMAHIETEDGIKNLPLQSTRVMYDGNLSRNILYMNLPTTSSEVVQYYFDIFDKNDNLVFRSFMLRYKVTGNT